MKYGWVNQHLVLMVAQRRAESDKKRKGRKLIWIDRDVENDGIFPKNVELLSSKGKPSEWIFLALSTRKGCPLKLDSLFLGPENVSEIREHLWSFCSKALLSHELNFKQDWKSWVFVRKMWMTFHQLEISILLRRCKRSCSGCQFSGYFNKVVIHFLPVWSRCQRRDE